MYTPNMIADWFLSRVDRQAGDVITHLKLQKLVYYAQAWTLALCDRPLFDEDFQAWTHGPVVPSLFQRFNGMGWNPLPAPEEDNCGELDAEVESLLEEVYTLYGEHSAKYLEQLTHSEEPWLNARGGRPLEARCTCIIPKDAMKAFYRAKLEAPAN